MKNYLGLRRFASSFGLLEYTSKSSFNRVEWLTKSWVHTEQQPQETVKVKVTPSCPTLCDPMDYTVHEILQVRIPEWVAIPFSMVSSLPRD